MYNSQTIGASHKEGGYIIGVEAFLACAESYMLNYLLRRWKADDWREAMHRAYRKNHGVKGLHSTTSTANSTPHRSRVSTPGLNAPFLSKIPEEDLENCTLHRDPAVWLEELEAAAVSLQKCPSELFQGAGLRGLSALYKQAMVGPCVVPRPAWSLLDMGTSAQEWDTWKGLGEMSYLEASRRYIISVDTAWKGTSIIVDVSPPNNAFITAEGLGAMGEFEISDEEEEGVAVGDIPVRVLREVFNEILTPSRPPESDPHGRRQVER